MENTNKVPTEVRNAAIEKTFEQFEKAFEKLSKGENPEEENSNDN